MKYTRKPWKTYAPAQKWVAKAFREQRKPRLKRYLVQYEAVVQGEKVSDFMYVQASSWKEAQRKAENIVKSMYPNAKGIVANVKEEHLSTWGNNV